MLRAVLGACVALAASTTGSATVVGPWAFGLHVHHAERVGWPDVGAGAWRLWDAQVAWPDLEPERGRFAWDRLDALVDLAARHGVFVVLPLGLSPAWASVRPAEPSAYAPGNAAPPAALADWEHYVAAVVGRYGGRVAAYEVWNEPNLAEFFGGTPADYVRLLASAAAIVRRIDPHALVVGPSATAESGVDYLDRVLALGAGQYLDVIGHHFYVLMDPPERQLSIIAGVHRVLAAYGVERPVWNTEIGYGVAARRPLGHAAATSASEPVREWYGRRLAEPVAADYLVRAYVLDLCEGVPRVFWYAWDDAGTGLVDPGTAAPTLVSLAYREMVRRLSGLRVGGWVARGEDGLWACRFIGRTRAVTVVWAPDRPRGFVPGAVFARSRLATRDVVGRTPDHPLPAAQAVPVTESPTYVEERRRSG